MTADPALVAPASHGQGVRQQPSKPRWQRWALAVALGSPLVFAVLNEFPICPTAGLLGLPCPGCGLTRATLLLLQGEFAAALSFHPLVIPLAPMYFGALGWFALELVRGPERPTWSPRWITQRWFSMFGVVVLFATMAVWGLRFFGYFGGPVPVQTYQSWAAAHAHR